MCEVVHTFFEKGISVDVIAMDSDYSKYDLVIAPFLYMLKDGTDKRIEDYVKNGGNFVATYLTAVVDKDDLCFLGGLPANNLKEVFGIWAEETDSLPEDITNSVSCLGKEYDVQHVCDIIHAQGAKILGEYKKDFYADMPALTENSFGKGKAYYVAFRNDKDFAHDFCEKLIEEHKIEPDCKINTPDGVFIRKRGEIVFITNFSDTERKITLDREYHDLVNGEAVSGEITLPVCGYRIIK